MRQRSSGREKPGPEPVTTPIGELAFGRGTSAIRAAPVGAAAVGTAASGMAPLRLAPDRRLKITIAWLTAQLDFVVDRS
jgi:hypothetical protein